MILLKLVFFYTSKYSGPRYSNSAAEMVMEPNPYFNTVVHVQLKLECMITNPNRFQFGGFRFFILGLNYIRIRYFITYIRYSAFVRANEVLSINESKPQISNH